MRVSSSHITAFLLALGMGFAHAQDYPQRPIAVIVAYPAGGMVDSVTRVVLEPVAKSLSQPVLVENRPGAEGTIGALAVKRAAADGYTLLSAGSFVETSPLLKLNPAFQSSDFTPVGIIGQGANVIVTSPKLPVTTLKEFIAYARARPAQLNAATGSKGGSVYLGTELFMHSTGVQMNPVPFRGANEMIPSLASGELHLAFLPASIATAMIKLGKVKALAVVAPVRLVNLPEVPTVLEAGLPASGMVAPWYGLVARTGTPEPVVARWNAEIGAALRSPAVREKLQQLGVTPMSLSVAEYGRMLAAERLQWATLFKERGIKPD